MYGCLTNENENKDLFIVYSFNVFTGSDDSAISLGTPKAALCAWCNGQFCGGL